VWIDAELYISNLLSLKLPFPTASSLAYIPSGKIQFSAKTINRFPERLKKTKALCE